MGFTLHLGKHYAACGYHIADWHPFVTTDPQEVTCDECRELMSDATLILRGVAALLAQEVAPEMGKEQADANPRNKPMTPERLKEIKAAVGETKTYHRPDCECTFCTHVLPLCDEVERLQARVVELEAELHPTFRVLKDIGLSVVDPHIMSFPLLQAPNEEEIFDDTDDSAFEG